MLCKFPRITKITILWVLLGLPAIKFWYKVLAKHKQFVQNESSVLWNPDHETGPINLKSDLMNYLCEPQSVFISLLTSSLPQEFQLWQLNDNLFSYLFLKTVEKLRDNAMIHIWDWMQNISTSPYSPWGIGALKWTTAEVTPLDAKW